MPLAHFVMLLLVVIAAAALTVAGVLLVSGTSGLSNGALLVLTPLGLLAYGGVRWLRDRDG